MRFNVINWATSGFPLHAHYTVGPYIAYWFTLKCCPPLPPEKEKQGDQTETVLALKSS